MINLQRELSRKNYELGQQEARLKNIINSIVDAIVIVDSQNKIRFANPEAGRLWEQAPEDLVGQELNLPRQGREVEIKKGDKESIYLDLRATSIQWENEPAELISLTDVSDKKKMEAIKEDVDMIMRHDLKSPLNGIISFPELLLMDNNLSKEQREYLSEIQAAGYRMLNMINMTLGLYQMEKGEYQLASIPVDLLSVIQDIKKDLASNLKRQAVSLQVLKNGSYAVDRDECLIFGERMLCYSMLSNLIKNSVEASPRGEKVRVDLEPIEDGKLRITVFNQGVIPQEVRERFGQKFVTFGKQKGTGLGVYSAKLIAETMQGSFDWSSDEKSGTKIFVTLPKVN